MPLDPRLRELERNALAEGTTQAHAALLRERLRAGDLTEAWLEVAARLEDPAAREVLGRYVPLAPLALLEQVEWDTAACLRAAVLGLPRMLAANMHPDPAPALEALRVHVEHGAQGVSEPCRASLRELSGGTIPRDWDLSNDPAGLLLYALLVAAGGGGLSRLRERLFDVLRSHERLLRQALVPWALAGEPRPAPPAAFVTTPAVRSESTVAAEEARRAFDAALESKETKARATELKKRIRAGELEKDHVGFAALLGDPAAWLVAKFADANPALVAPGGTSVIASELARMIRNFAKRLPKDMARRIVAARRKRDEHDDVEEDDLFAWPDWSRVVMARIALALGERGVAELERLGADAAPAREALAAALRYFGRSGSAEDAVALGKAAVVRRGSDEVRRASETAGWAAQLVVRCLDKARQPRLDYARQNLLDAALEIGLDAEELWQLIRETAIARALRHDELGSEARPYAPGETYAEGERLSHPKFGEGRVTSVVGNKIQVAFEDGVKTLVHASRG